MKNLDPGRDDAGARLRRLRLRRGMPLTVLADRCGVSAAFLSMVENGHRELRRLSHIIALADELETSPLYLAYGIQAGQGGPVLRQLPAAFPALAGSATLSRHGRLAAEFARLLARGDSRAAGDWLRRLAREPGVNPWLLIDQLAAWNISHRMPPRCKDPGRCPGLTAGSSGTPAGHC
jgi:transcriptional regulator with XRE-family HTH domain